MAKPNSRRVRNGRVGEHGQVQWTSDSMEKMGSVVSMFGAMVSDGWKNISTGLGIQGRDKRLGSTFAGAPRLSHNVEFLNELYHGDDLVARIINLTPQEMYREWIDLTAGTEEGRADQEMSALIIQKLDELGAQTHFTDAEVWSDLYGGSLIIIGADDKQDASEPLDMDRIETVDFLNVVDRFEVEVDSFYDDPMEDKFGLPKTYRLTATSDVQPPQGVTQIKGEFNAIVHESRTIRFEGQRTSRRKRRENKGWGDSVLERYIDVIRDFQGASAGIMHLLHDFSQGVFKIKGLAKALASDKDQLVIKRLMMLDIARSIVRAVPLDADGEEFERRGAGVAGLADLYDRMMMRMSAATSYPVTMLFGRSPAGMNATGESDIRLYYDHVSARQETQARPRIEYLLQVLFHAKQGPTGGKEPDSWNFEFNPLFQESAKEKAEARLAVAKADEVYLRQGVLDPDEVANSRFGGDTYSPETMLDDEARAVREANAAAMEATLPIVIEDNRDDAPHYRVQDDEERQRQICSTCVHGAGGVCRRYAFTWDPGHTCDDWQTVSPLITADRYKLDRKRRRKRKGGRGRNY